MKVNDITESNIAGNPRDTFAAVGCILEADKANLRDEARSDPENGLVR